MKIASAKSIIKRFLISAAAFVLIFTLAPADTFTVYAADNLSMDIYGIYLGDSGGDSTLVASAGEFLLMDLGGVDSYYTIRNFLRARGIGKETKISLYLSHLHSDHTGGIARGNGLDQFLTDFNVDKLYLPDPALIPELDDQFTARYKQIKKLFVTHGYSRKKIVYLNVGDTFTVGDINAEIIGPVGMEWMTNAEMAATYSAGIDLDGGLHNAYINNLSLAAKLTCGDTVFLTTGDSRFEEETALANAYGESLKADIFKLAHHGNSDSNCEAFLSCVQPRYSYCLNSGPASVFFTDEMTGLTRRKTYESRARAAQYGVVYMVGDERKSVCYRVTNDRIRMFTEADGFKHPLYGLVKLQGGSEFPSDRILTDDDPYYYSYYYMTSPFVVFRGVRKINGKMYYFGQGGCRENGSYSRETGQYVRERYYSAHGCDNCCRIYDENDGSMITGWYSDTTGGGTSYFDRSTGFMLRETSVIGDKEYLISNEGLLLKRQWRKDENGGWKYYGKYGTLVTGWLTQDDKTFYLDPETGCRVTGTQKIGGVKYKFTQNGVLRG